jgi:hypothetical protein
MIAKPALPIMGSVTQPASDVQWILLGAVRINADTGVDLTAPCNVEEKE